MSINKAFSHECIILDACCIINLYASKQMRSILETMPSDLAVAVYVKENEALSVFSGPNNNVQSSKESIDLQSFIKDGLLFLVDIETDSEANTFINLAENLDDGEAITGAIALNRNWSIATDDSVSLKLFGISAPHIALVTTLDIVKYWADIKNPDNDTIRETLLNIRLRGRYEPHRGHHLIDWWEQFR